jgi:hypothetical protein
VATLVEPQESSLPGCSIIRRPRRNQSGTAAIESQSKHAQEGITPMNGIIYLVGLVVVILAVLSFFGLR